ncbi:MAG: hypothetical protein ACI4I6_01575 [Hominimerdicola sp.]
MKFWTIQTKRVVEVIKEKGIYQPNFNQSRYLKINNNLNSLYSFIIQSFNQVNKTDLPGVVFAFAKSEGNMIFEINTFDEFKKFIISKKRVIEGFWNKLDINNHIIIELDYEVDFNPMYVDINDFQFIMPPIIIFPPYTQESEHKIRKYIGIGKFSASVFPSNVIQVHLPYIEEKNVLNIYPLFDID